LAEVDAPFAAYDCAQAGIKNDPIQAVEEIIAYHGYFRGDLIASAVVDTGIIEITVAKQGAKGIAIRTDTHAHQLEGIIEGGCQRLLVDVLEYSMVVF